jgi:LacI family transcriptional regulator
MSSIWGKRLGSGVKTLIPGATLKDVAALANVSISTVSRVIRGDRSRAVEATTEARIWDAVRDLDYRPNLAARALARGEHGPGSPHREIGVVLGTTSYKFSDPFFARVMEGVDAEILAHRRHVRFVYSIADLAEERLLSEMVRPDVIGGLIGVGLRADALLRLAATGVTPIVVVEGPEPVRGVDFVLCDKEGATAQIMQHLWSLGHRRFAFLGTSWEERCIRFRSWLALTDAPTPVLVDMYNAWTMEAGYGAMQRLLGDINMPRPTAVVCACDGLAVGALRAARELGVDVPADLAVVGFDDTMGAFTNPSLTSVTVRRDQLGRLAVRRLIERQQHPDEPAVRIVEATELVVRDSCGAPRQERPTPKGGETS